tara:strand:- start:108 stop:452 length:345 start_codon:yes stop_codon:yes gene_type:complete
LNNKEKTYNIVKAQVYYALNSRQYVKAMKKDDDFFSSRTGVGFKEKVKEMFGLVTKLAKTKLDIEMSAVCMTGSDILSMCLPLNDNNADNDGDVNLSFYSNTGQIVAIICIIDE